MSISSAAPLKSDTEKQQDELSGIFELAKKYIPMHKQLMQSLGFSEFIRGIEIGLKQSRINDNRKYIPILILTLKVMQLVQDSLAYQFAMDRLLEIVNEFEAIRKNPGQDQSEKYQALNIKVQKIFAVAESLMSTVTRGNPCNKDVREVGNDQIQIILGYYREIAQKKLTKEGYFGVEATLLYRDLDILFKQERDRYDVVKALQTTLIQLSDILDTPPSPLRDVVVIYLMGASYRFLPSVPSDFRVIPRVGDNIIRKLFQKDFEHAKLYHLFLLMNKITSNFLLADKKSHAVVEKYDAIVNQFIKQYEDNVITLDILDSNCRALFNILNTPSASFDSFNKLAQDLLQANIRAHQLAAAQRPLEDKVVLQPAPFSQDRPAVEILPVKKGDIFLKNPSPTHHSCVTWLKILLGAAALIAGGALLILAAGATNLLIGGGILAAVGFGLFAHGMYDRYKHSVVYDAPRVNMPKS